MIQQLHQPRQDLYQEQAQRQTQETPPQEELAQRQVMAPAPLPALLQVAAVEVGVVMMTVGTTTMSANGPAMKVAVAHNKIETSSTQINGVHCVMIVAW